MAGTIVLTGRSKDTIVLSNGENIEPQPIEDACCASSYISNMIVVGQDKRTLGALVVPNKEAFEELEKIKGMDIIRALNQQHKITSYQTVLLIRLTWYHCVDSMDWNKQCWWPWSFCKTAAPLSLLIIVHMVGHKIPRTISEDCNVTRSRTISRVPVPPCWYHKADEPDLSECGD